MKRREIEAAQERDARISSLQSELQRLNSEVETYRRFKTRAKAIYNGSSETYERNQEEELSILLEKQQETIKDLEENLRTVKKVHVAEIQKLQSEIESMQTKSAVTIDKLREELVMLIPRESKIQTEQHDESPAVQGHIAELMKLKSTSRLLELDLRKITRELGREKRRAERAEEESESLRKQLQAITNEQKVKDNQLFSLRNELLDTISKPDTDGFTPSEGKEGGRIGENADDESYEDVLKEELACMRDSFESRIRTLKDQLFGEQEKVRTLQLEVEELRPKSQN